MNIVKYISHHAEKIFKIDGNNVKEISPEINENKNNKNLYDFKISFDENNFSDEKDTIDKLSKLVKELDKIKVDSSFDRNRIRKVPIEKQYEYEKKAKENGIQIINKENIKEIWNGKERDLIKYIYKKTQRREGTLKDSFVAIHTKSYEEIEGKKNYNVKPHIHIVFEKSKNNFGKNFNALNRELSKLCSEHNLISSVQLFNRTDLNKEEKIEMKILKDRLTNFSWVIAKHEDGKYAIKQLEKYKSNKAVNIKNIQEKSDRYLELGGSFSFIKKLKINLKNKLNIDLELNKSKDDLISEKNIKEKNYKDIIEHISYKAVTGNKISEIYRNFSLKNNKVDNIKDVHLKKAIGELFLASIKKIDSNRDLYIDIENINTIKEKYLNIFKVLDKNENKIEEKLFKILEQNELREFVKTNKIDIKKLTGKNEFELLYENNLNYVKDNINLEEINIGKQIENLNLKLSDKWKFNIIKYVENYLLKNESKNNILDIKNDYNKNLKNILYQNKLREFIKNNKIDVRELTGKSEFELLYENNLIYAKKNINISGEKILDYYKNKTLKNEIENQMKILNLEISNKWSNSIIKEITNEKLQELNKFKIIDLNNEYIKSYSMVKFFKKLENEKINIIEEIENKKTNINKLSEKEIIIENKNISILNNRIEEINKTLKRFEIKNYINYLEKRFELEKSELDYRKKFDSSIGHKEEITAEIEKINAKSKIIEMENKNTGEKVYIKFNTGDKEVRISDKENEFSKEVYSKNLGDVLGEYYSREYISTKSTNIIELSKEYKYTELETKSKEKIKINNENKEAYLVKTFDDEFNRTAKEKYVKIKQEKEIKLEFTNYKTKEKIYIEEKNGKATGRDERGQTYNFDDMEDVFKTLNKDYFRSTKEISRELKEIERKALIELQKKREKEIER